MRIPESILRYTVGTDLYNKLETYRLTNDAQMPFVYQKLHGRYLHDDWFTFKDTPRFDCARRVPIPYKIIEGICTKEWLDFDPNYPLSPDMETRRTADGVFQVLTDRGGYGMVKYAAFIENEWIHVFKKYTKAYTILGTRYRHSWYVGLHQDNNPQDLMCWIEPFAMSFVKEI